MRRLKKAKCLKIDCGRYRYQCRVLANLQKLLGFEKSQASYFGVDYAKAVQLVVTSAEEHNEPLARLWAQDGYNENEAVTLSLDREAWRRFIAAKGLATPARS